MHFAAKREFVVHAVPVAQPRHRAVAINGHVGVYGADKSHPVHAFKAQVRIVAGQIFGQPFEGPLRVDVQFVLPRPQSKIFKRRPNPRFFCGYGRNIDNLQKALFDALNGVAWRDDAQVAVVVASKVVAAPDECPRVIVRIRELVQNHQVIKEEQKCLC